MAPSTTCAAPLYTYLSAGGASITGGVIPSGCGWDNVWAGEEYYVFADWSKQTLQGLEVAATHRSITMPPTVIDVLPTSQVANGPASIELGPDGALYVVYYTAGAVHRITPKSLCGPQCPLP
jgi:hypothetical protein